MIRKIRLLELSAKISKELFNINVDKWQGCMLSIFSAYRALYQRFRIKNSAYSFWGDALELDLR